METKWKLKVRYRFEKAETAIRRKKGIQVYSEERTIFKI